MTDKAHSQVNEGSRHAIHNLTYPNAANRIAGTGEGKGINPPTSANLWQVAKQDDDGSLWHLVDVSPLKWVQIVTSGSGGNTDDTYDNFGSGPGGSTIVVDGAEGQGDSLTWDLNGGRYYIVDLVNATVKGESYNSGFIVENGLDSLAVYKVGVNTADFVGKFNETKIFSSDIISFSLDTNISSGGYFGLGTASLPSTAGLNASSGVQSFVSIDAPINQSGTAGYNALLIDADVNAVGSGEQNLLNVQLAGSDRFRVNSEGNVRVGTGAPTSATGAGDFYVTGDIELGNNLYIKDNASVTLGTSSDVQIRYSTIQTPDSLLIGVGTDSNAAILCQKGDLGFDFAHGVAADPTLIGHSASQSTTEYWSLTHDKTHARMVTGAGAFCVGTGTPGVATGVGDLYVTGNVEVDVLIYADGGVQLGLDDSIGNNPGSFGAYYGRITSQTLDASFLTTGTVGNYLLFCEDADKGFDFAHSAAVDPTLIGHSASQSTTEYWSLTHDKTHARMVTGAGAFCVGTGTPGVATGVGDFYATGDIEADGNADIAGYVQTASHVQAQTYVASNGTFRLPSNGRLYNTTGGSSFYARQTGSTNAIGVLTTGTESEILLICQDADASFNFAHSAAVDPTLIGHSANQSTTEYWSLTHDKTHARMVTGAGAFCVGTGTPASASVPGDLFTSGIIESNGLIRAKSGVFLPDNQTIGFSTGYGFLIGRNTAQNIDAMTITVGSSANYLLFCEDADKGFDFAHGVATDPTLIGHSRNQSTTEWWSLTHNTTDIVLSGGAGALSLQPATGEVKLPDAGKVVYDNTPSSDLTASGDIVSATVDANATGIGAALYQKSNGAWAEAKADSLSTMPCRAVALETGTGTKKILRRNGWIRKDAFSLTTKGAPVYVSAATAGAFTHTKPSTTGDQVQIVGYIDDTNNVLDFNPSMTIVEVA